MINEKLCGTFWLVKSNGKKYITQGDKPINTMLGWKRRLGNTPWLCVEGEPDNFNISTTKEGNGIESSDYKNISFPDPKEGEALEIEIGKSGRVYTYES